MSQQCRMVEIPVLNLKPRWVEFTSTRGVLRCLQPQEAKTRAQGVVFMCPRCNSSKEKQHYCIFLFKNSPPQARPQGRFSPNWDHSFADPAPADFDKLTLHEIDTDERCVTEWLHPRDLRCRWTGSLYKGMVSWRPNFLERVFKK